MFWALRHSGFGVLVFGALGFHDVCCSVFREGYSKQILNKLTLTLNPSIYTCIMFIHTYAYIRTHAHTRIYIYIYAHTSAVL